MFLVVLKLSSVLVCTESINNVFNHMIVEEWKVIFNYPQNILNTSCSPKLLEEGLKQRFLGVLGNSVKCTQWQEMGDQSVHSNVLLTQRLVNCGQELLKFEYYFLWFHTQPTSKFLLLLMGESTHIEVWERGTFWNGFWTTMFNITKECAVATPTPKWWPLRSVPLTGRAKSLTAANTFKGEDISWSSTASTQVFLSFSTQAFLGSEGSFLCIWRSCSWNHCSWVGHTHVHERQSNSVSRFSCLHLLLSLGL